MNYPALRYNYTTHRVISYNTRIKLTIEEELPGQRRLYFRIAFSRPNGLWRWTCSAGVVAIDVTADRVPRRQRKLLCF